MREFFVHTYDLIIRCGAALLGFLGGLGSGQRRGGLLLVLLMAADYATGLIAALKGKSPQTPDGKHRAAVGFQGLLRKAAMAAVLLFSLGLDQLLSEGNHMFYTAVLWMYISSECLSLLENLALCGVPVPRRLRMLLERLARRQGLSQEG